MKRLLLTIAMLLGMSATAMAATTCTPVSTSGAAGSTVCPIVETPTLTGPNADRFAVSGSNLVVGSTALAPGTYSVSVDGTAITVVVSQAPPTADVCPSGCKYTTIAAAVSAAAAGATINIKGGNTYGCLEIPSSKTGLTLAGVGGMFKIVTVCQSKGGIIVSAPNTTIKGYEAAGLNNGDNAAGIRGQVSSGSLTLDNVYIHGNNEGMLGGAPLTIIKNSTFDNNGRSGYEHNIYIGVAKLVIINTVSTRAKGGGHQLKSRSNELEVTCSVLATLDGADSYENDNSQGGKVTLKNNVFEKGPNTNRTTIVSYAPESLSNGAGAFAAAGNIVINDSGGTVPFAKFWQQPSSTDISGNTLVAASAPGSNTSFTSRAAAGLAAYPALPALPAACGGIVPGYDPARAQ